MKPEDLDISENLNRLIKTSGLTVGELAKKAGMKQPTTIRRILAGNQYNLKLSTIMSLANALDCNMFDLLGVSPLPKRGVSGKVKELIYKLLNILEYEERGILLTGIINMIYEKLEELDEIVQHEKKSTKKTIQPTKKPKET